MKKAINYFCLFTFIVAVFGWFRLGLETVLEFLVDALETGGAIEIAIALFPYIFGLIMAYILMKEWDRAE